MPVQIQPHRAPDNEPVARQTSTAAWRGFCLKCPACGRGAIFRAFLKISDRCPACGEDLSHHRADDAPAYVTIVIVGHIVVGGLLVLEKAMAPPAWVQLSIWLPLTLVLSLVLLPRIKGALVGFQWASRMHGFDGEDPAAGAGPGRPAPHDIDAGRNS